MLDRFARHLFESGARRVVIDPHPNNGRAIRAYQKAGFAKIDERTRLGRNFTLVVVAAVLIGMGVAVAWWLSSQSETADAMTYLWLV